MSNVDNQIIITVSGRDKVGIVAGVSNKLLQPQIKTFKVHSLICSRSLNVFQASNMLLQRNSEAFNV